ncbi:MAG: hypothetical protein JSV27_07845, partial [Candidatus Bathyarchaeota archaeon]
MVSLKLLLASVWLPDFVLKGELEKVATTTTDALRSLLEEVAPNELQRVSMEIKTPTRTIEERRAVMATNHSLLVKSLSDGIGHDRAVELGREALLKVGVRLGKESRKRLGIGDSVEDLLMAARVMYRVLGIRFTFSGEGGEHRVEMQRCALSDHYSELTCTVLSAIDEGVVRGLNPKA